ncbi:MAG TPA: MarR family transcriptional regulator [Candidatus Krumholzibacteria bacterium]|nr:MarR family transcriptional regulator [Candidatus Krumholzibacteria bacterium]
MSKLQKEIKQNKPFRSRRQEAVLAIVRTADVLKRRWRVAEEFGVTGQQYNVLRILRGAHPEPLPTMEIASRMIENTPGITGLLDRLEEKGLVQRARDADDRRCSRCSITAKGMKLLAEMDEPINQSEEAALSILDGKDVDRLIDILEQVRAHNN